MIGAREREPREPAVRLALGSLWQSRAGLPNPNENRAVRQVRDGLRRTYGVATVRQAHPLSVAEIRTLVTGIDRTTLGDARDAAFILLGYAGALRIGELAALALDDIESRPDGIVLRTRPLQAARGSSDLLQGVLFAYACR